MSIKWGEMPSRDPNPSWVYEPDLEIVAEETVSAYYAEETIDKYYPSLTLMHELCENCDWMHNYSGGMYSIEYHNKKKGQVKLNIMVFGNMHNDVSIPSKKEIFDALDEQLEGYIDETNVEIYDALRYAELEYIASDMPAQIDVLPSSISLTVFDPDYPKNTNHELRYFELRYSVVTILWDIKDIIDQSLPPDPPEWDDEWN